MNRDKSVFFGIMGSNPESDGIHYCAAHIDSPRLDLKPQPLCEDNGIAMLKTHYYGGIKKYQWTALPLEMEGVAVTRDGKTVDFSQNGYTFCITDPFAAPCFGAGGQNARKSNRGRGFAYYLRYDRRTD